MLFLLCRDKHNSGPWGRVEETLPVGRPSVVKSSVEAPGAGGGAFLQRHRPLVWFTLGNILALLISQGERVKVRQVERQIGGDR